MSGKNILKSLVAFGVLAIALIFLGVNYVPRISALSPAKDNTVYTGSDWIERHPANVVSGFRTPPMSNYFPSISVTGFRTPPMSNYFPPISVTGFRTPPMSDYIQPIGTERFFTPPPADYTP